MLRADLPADCCGRGPGKGTEYSADIRRMLKRYLARDLYRASTPPPNSGDGDKDALSRPRSSIAATQ